MHKIKQAVQTQQISHRAPVPGAPPACRMKQYLLGVRYLLVEGHEKAVGQDDEHDEQTEERNEQR